MAGNRESRFERIIGERKGRMFGNAFTALPKPHAFMRPFLRSIRDIGSTGVSTGGSARHHNRGASRSAHTAALGGEGTGGSNGNSNAGSRGEDTAQR